MKIHPYETGETLGMGTVAETFLARDSRGKMMVVKKLKAELARNAKVAEQFLNASNLTKDIKMPRFLAMVRMQSTIGDDVFLVREYVEGKSLAQLHKDGELASLNPRQLAYDLCDALRSLHLQGIVHGGIHPGNVVVQKDGHLKLMDFGISRAHLTGQVDRNYPVGALRYLAPEQWRSQSSGLAADLFAAALIVVLLTERRELLPGTSFTEIKDQALAGLTLDCPILAQALQRDPGRRFAGTDPWRAALKTLFDARDAGGRAVIEPPPCGSLQAMIDVKDGIDLLPLNHGRPWRLERSGRSQQWPIYFTNGGPGDLLLRVYCLGEGVRLSPTDRLRVRPGQSRYVIVTLDSKGSDFVRLDVEWEGQKPSERVQLRIYRPKST